MRLFIGLYTGNSLQFVANLTHSIRRARGGGEDKFVGFLMGKNWDGKVRVGSVERKIPFSTESARGRACQHGVIANLSR